MFELIDIRKLIEEGPDRIERNLKKLDLPFEKEQSLEPFWSIGHWYPELSVGCGTVCTQYPTQLSYTLLHIKEKVFEGLHEDITKEVRIHRYHRSVNSDRCHIELAISIMPSLWGRIFNEYSLCDLATKLGPKLYQALVRDIKEFDGTS